jgi:hypothetical protein
MKQSPVAQLEAPRFEKGKPLLIAGVRHRYTAETMNNIPARWQRFLLHIGKIPGQVGRVAYGLCFNALSPDGIDYLAGVEVSSSSWRIQCRDCSGTEICRFFAPRAFFEAPRNAGCHPQVASGIRA